MLRLILNCSNISKGGGVQVSLEFISQVLSLSGEYQVLVVASDVVFRQLDKRRIEGIRIVCLTHNVTSRIVKGKSYRELQRLESDFKPDFVVSVFGPVYWRPSAPHVVGLANAWSFDFQSIAWESLGPLSWLKMRIMVAIKNRVIKDESDYLYTETNLAKTMIAKSLDVSIDDIVVSNNGANYHFLENSATIKDAEYKHVEAEFRILLLSAYYPHKNIAILRDVIPLVSSNCRFVLTLPESAYKAVFGEGNDQIINVGPVKSSECPALYASCDAVILPSLLETFSANYVEAMVMKKPILTSDLEFAHEVCGKAALYFNPTSPESIANKIEEIIASSELRLQLIESGLDRLKGFDNPKKRLTKIIDFIVEKIGVF